MLVPKLSLKNILVGWYKVFKSRFHLYKKCVRHPFRNIFIITLWSPPWIIELKDGKVEKVTDREHLYALVYSYSNPQPSSRINWDFKDKQSSIVLETYKASDGKEVFESQIYNWLPVKEKTVIDIGSNIGDTAIYFALKDASSVIGFESNAEIYKISLHNVDNNNLSTKISLFNKIVTGSFSKDNIHFNAHFGKFRSINSHNSGPIKQITLDKIVSECNIKDGSLKIDCEGAEYEIILSSKFNVLRKFTHIQMEYHFGFKILENYLKRAGFYVKVSRNRYSATPGRLILMQCGDLYATRDDDLE